MCPRSSNFHPNFGVFRPELDNTNHTPHTTLPMTARELAEKLNNLPEEQKDLPLFAYNDLEEAYSEVLHPKVVPYSEARYVKADYPWIDFECETKPEGNFIQI